MYTGRRTERLAGLRGAKDLQSVLGAGASPLFALYSVAQKCSFPNLCADCRRETQRCVSCQIFGQISEMSLLLHWGWLDLAGC